MAPLTDLLRGDSKKKLLWTAQHDLIHDKIKRLLSTPPILLAPTLHKTFILCTDCSATAMGYCLKQEKNGVLHPVSYGSRRLSPSGASLSTFYKNFWRW